MRKRVSQPPIDREKRCSESRPPWPGLVVVLLGAVCAGIGWGRLTQVQTIEGNATREPQINLAFAHGGLTKARNPAFESEAGVDLPPWIQGQGGFRAQPETFTPLSTKNLRINLQAKSPCPT